MFSSLQRNERRPKNIITISQLSTYIDKEKPPTKKEPFRTICDVPFCHTLSLVASADYGTDEIQKSLAQAGTLHYARVHMKLLDIVSGSFFDDYIKTGNILMLSEGRPGIDETYTLREGILRLEVGKPTFEQLGLDGKVVESQGRKHTKARYAIELNLRLPSMVCGKNGFERALRAFTNVLTDTKTWLFCNLKAPADLSGPIKAYAPVAREVTPAIQHMKDVLIPTFSFDVKEDTESILDLQEWFSLVSLQSPRVGANDKVDSYLSRYAVPQRQSNSSTEAGKTAEVIQAQWRGLVHADFVKILYMSLLKSGSSTGWLAVSGHAFDGSSYTIMRKDKKVVICHYMD